MNINVGEAWSYRTAQGFEGSCLVIGAVLTFANGATVVCCAVRDAPMRQPDGHLTAATIPFLPMSEAAFESSVVAPLGPAELPGAFNAALETWRDDPRGLSIFTVPFEGSLDRMIASQMAAIIGSQAA